MVENPRMSERENIFARIREALTVAAPRPGHAHDGHAAAGDVSLPKPEDHRRVMPLVGASPAEQLALFQKMQPICAHHFNL